MDQFPSPWGFARMLCRLVVSVGFASAEIGGGQDEEALKALVTAYCDAWNTHDGRALARIMAEDVDYVNVGARWFQGKADVEWMLCVCSVSTPLEFGKAINKETNIKRK